MFSKLRWNYTMLNHTFIDFRIAASLMNCFFSPSISDAEDSYEIAQEMKKKVKSKTILEKYIKKNKKSYNILDSSAIIDFPRLDVHQIRSSITFGWYQLNQGLGYLGEHLSKNGRYEFRVETHINTDGTKIVGAIFQSRHTRRIKYEIFVQYTPDIDSIESILGWVCTCFAGNRTCGCCSHVAALIFYLAYGKHQVDPLKKPAECLSDLCVVYDTEDCISESENTDESYIEDTANMKNLSFSLKRDLSVSDCISELSKKLKSTQKSTQSILSSQANKIYESDIKNAIPFREFSKKIPLADGSVDIVKDDYNNDSFINYNSKNRTALR